jgi:hypothetical protein
MEGVLLRYLSQVHSTLARNLPEAAQNAEILEVIAFLRAMLARIDSSLVEEWENLVSPAAPAESPRDAVPDRAPRRLDRKAFDARVRAELHQLLQALSRGDYEGAAACVASVDGDEWDAARFETGLQPILESQGAVRTDPEARKGHWTQISTRSALEYDVVQTLIDEDGEGAGQIELEVILEEARMPSGPMLRVRALRS